MIAAIQSLVWHGIYVDLLQNSFHLSHIPQTADTHAVVIVVRKHTVFPETYCAQTGR